MPKLDPRILAFRIPHPNFLMNHRQTPFSHGSQRNWKTLVRVIFLKHPARISRWDGLAGLDMNWLK
jgi:hypothetical protein